MDLIYKAFLCKSLLRGDLLLHMCLLTAPGGTFALVQDSTVPSKGFWYNSVQLCVEETFL